MTAPLLDVRAVSRFFGGFPAVADVSLQVREGEILGIAGPNGAGKSTLFNLVSGVPFGPSRGEVWFDGRRVDRLAASRISRAGLRRTFQSEQLFPALTVLDNVLVAAAYLGGGGIFGHRARRAEAERALETAGISGYAADLAGDVPLLVKKKLMIASALVARPRLLMLDEPAGGLNTEDQRELTELLRGLNAAGLTLLIIEHVLSLLRELAGRMIVLTAGSVLVEGTPREVLSDPRVMEAYLGEGVA
ncbi:branched-chain amino acid transport system ATP-binding protein [Amycolatopsis sacchari]|uniref:Branched-chain amino acid transport system ATP-binding protein n=1 Tax=Amycolatopsis sacchari TaxID=115433 RepID=A0A1I4BL62_9PSEU|nr:branched-chain amino acid transport system ATP-binding protein [Amycolatopsis sacchari]